MVDYVYYFIISLFIVVFTIGITNIWTKRYDSYFIRFLVGPISFSKNDNDLVLKKLKYCITINYFYNLFALVTLLVIYPTNYPIIMSGLTLSIPLIRRFITKYFKTYYGFEEDNRFKNTNKILLWILLLGMIGISIYLVQAENPLAPMIIIFSVYIILAILLKSLSDFSKRKADETPIDKMKDSFRE